MRNNHNIKNIVNSIVGDLVGDNLFDALKELILEDQVLSGLFGSNGERLFFNSNPPYNFKTVPMLELWWGSENKQGHDTKVNGTIDGRILLPTSINNRPYTKYNRLVATALARYFDSDKFYRIFEMVKGLEAFGSTINFNYSKIIKFNNFDAAAITLTIPYTFDLVNFRRASADVDFTDYLDADLLADLITTSFDVDSEDGDEVFSFDEDIEGV